MGVFSSLSREQKEAIGLLQIGTFLEYFDLMLYLHMAVLLNELFFPKTDPQTAALLAAFAFCSTYVLRPFGALMFGWIGDNIGRKSTIILTTVLMSISCIIMANLPTYAQIGITATWIMTLCRMTQGISSMGEIMSAEIYVTESIPRPTAYPAVSFISIAANIGGMVAVGIAALVTSANLNWRIAFWIGAIIALVGSVARTRLRETPAFLKMQKQKMRKAIEELNLEGDPKGAEANASWKEPIETNTLISYFLIFCGWPLCFYLVFIYFNPMLKENFGYSSQDIIHHNFYLSVISVIVGLFLSFLSYRIHPIKIIKIKAYLILLVMIFLPFWIKNIASSHHLFILQSVILLLSLGSLPADAVFLSHLPIYCRVTYASFLFALARALMYIITSFGLVYLGSYFGPYGLWFITLPITCAFLYGVRYFEQIERNHNLYESATK